MEGTDLAQVRAASKMLQLRSVFFHKFGAPIKTNRKGGLSLTIELFCLG